MTPKLRRFLDESRAATPYLVVDVDIVEHNYRALAGALDGVRIFYAVKANPAPEIIVALLSNPAIESEGTVREVSPVADPATRTYQVKVTLKDPPELMRFGKERSGRPRPGGPNKLSGHTKACDQQTTSRGSMDL